MPPPKAKCILGPPAKGLLFSKKPWFCCWGSSRCPYGLFGMFGLLFLQQKNEFSLKRYLPRVLWISFCEDRYQLVLRNSRLTQRAQLRRPRLLQPLVNTRPTVQVATESDHRFFNSLKAYIALKHALLDYRFLNFRLIFRFFRFLLICFVFCVINTLIDCVCRFLLGLTAHEWG